MSAILEFPIQYWPTWVASVVAILGALRWLGFLTRPADAGDLKVFQTKLQVLEGFHHENREEHSHIRDKNEREHQEIRGDIGKVAASLARIEGKLEGKR
jgi:hypothetical protein